MPRLYIILMQAESGIEQQRSAAMIELSDEDIRRRLTDIEDSTVERKTASDYRDCLKTAVAFSNSLPVGDPGIIFVGVYDDGRVQDGQNLEELQKNVSKELSKVYPPIYSQMKVLKDRNDKQFVAVIVRQTSAASIRMFNEKGNVVWTAPPQ